LERKGGGLKEKMSRDMSCQSKLPARKTEILCFNNISSIDNWRANEKNKKNTRWKNYI